MDILLYLKIYKEILPSSPTVEYFKYFIQKYTQKYIDEYGLNSRQTMAYILVLSIKL